MNDPRIEELLARYIEQKLRGGEPDVTSLCAEYPDLAEPLRKCIVAYDALDRTLDHPAARSGDDPQIADRRDLPQFEGFRTIERLGGGGGGEVYKLEDVELGRIVAGKVIRGDSPLRTNLDDFLREARALALFDDPHIVSIHEFRGHADPPVLIMEYVEGFELGRMGPSLEYAQRARVMTEIVEAIERAHRLGVQHRDLKPANVMLDADLSPRILDFGLSRGEPDRGHGVGTLSYMAPERLDPDRPIDARVDVYALGVMLYELLCGVRPFEGRTTEDLIRAVKSHTPLLPVEVESTVPEPLQAIALKAMERDPADRYGTAREMAQELRRFAEGKPVLARPTMYQSVLERRVRPHIEQIREWRRLKLIHRHEQQRLEDSYEKLHAREDDWIVRARTLAFSQIGLYLGAFLLVAGSLLYLGAYFFDAVQGLLGPTMVLGLPFVALNVVAHRLYGRGKQAVAVAVYLGAVLLLPLYLVIVFEELGLWVANPESELELLGLVFEEGFTSNRQLQIASFAACLWAGWLAVSTRTVTMSACFTVLLFAFDLSVQGDFGLRAWLEEAAWHRLAVHLVPLLILVAALGWLAERREQPWLTQPLYFAGAGLFMLVPELLALNGKMFEFLGLSMSTFQVADVSSPALLDTLTAMTVNGVAIYAAGSALERHGSALMRSTAWLLYVVSPFAILQPISRLVWVGEYALRYDWLYLVLALAITFLSHYRQRKSFYYAGLLNTGTALWFITDHYEWFDRPAWAIAVLTTGILALVTGWGLHVRERTRPGA